MRERRGEGRKKEETSFFSPVKSFFYRTIQVTRSMSLLPSAKGELFRYSDSAAACVAFDYDLSRDDKGKSNVAGDETAATTTTTTANASTSTPKKKKKTKLAVVAVGGLTDGFFAVPYLPHLAELLQAEVAKNTSSSSWSLITPLLSSSHRGWGTSSLDRDADELLELSAHLRSQRGIEGIVLLGHSTGCQDAVRYAEREMQPQQSKEESKGRDANKRARLLGVILQAPVSDRECFFLLDPVETARLSQERLDKAQEAIQAGKDPEKTVIDFMSDWDGAPLSAKRWLSLAARGGDDDMFSSDFSDEELSEKMRALKGERAIPVLIISSLREQYMPSSYDVAAHGRRLADAINQQQLSTKGFCSTSPKSPTAEAVAFDGDHALRGAEAEAARVIFGFVSEKCHVPTL